MYTSSSNIKLFKRLLVRFILSVLLILTIFYLVPKVIHLLFPILLAYLVAAIVNPLVNKMNYWLSKTKLNYSFSRNIITLLLTLIILIIISVAIYLVTAKIVQQIIGLALNIQDDWPSIVSAFEKLESWIGKQVVILPGPAVELLENFTESILNFIQNFSSNLLTHTVSSTGWVISRTGTF